MQNDAADMDKKALYSVPIACYNLIPILIPNPIQNNDRGEAYESSTTTR